MKRVLLACCGVIALAGAAVAADLSRRPPPPVVKAPPAYPTIYNWTGLYFGANGGFAWGTSKWDSTGDFDVKGGLAGGTLGFNWQTGQLVYGLEGDFDWSNIKGTTNANCPAGCETKISWLSTVRGRLGLGFDRVMPYVTGGLALGNIKASVPGEPGKSDTNAGWTAGGGLEVALWGNWSGKAEYLYVDLGKMDCGISCGGGPAFTTDNVTFTSHIVRGGINYRF
jgi:outer membrane immunogenic protein